MIVRITEIQVDPANLDEYLEPVFDTKITGSP